MSAYADSSFLVSLYGSDPNSKAALSLHRHHQPVFLVTPFCEMEFTNTVFAIAARPKGWTVAQAQTMERDFIQDLQSGVWHWEDMPSGAWTRARELSRLHAPALGCRATDALHVASALVLGARDFYTFDKDQAKLARAAGLRVLGS